MSKKTTMKRTLLSLLIAAIGAPQAALATPFNFPTTPPGTAQSQPAPNIILSIDDSGSMWEGLDGKYCRDGSNNITACPAPGSKINILKESLLTVFGDPTVNPPTKGVIEDNQIRLAWQAMHNNGNSPDAGNLLVGSQQNGMRPLSGGHRTNFGQFIKNINAGAGTPSHKMVAQAYNYMKAAKSPDGPWASRDANENAVYLGCRRTFHIFMTDGDWNGDKTEGDGYTVGNADGTATTLGDGTTAYRPNATQTKVYSDVWGANPPTTNLPNPPSTLADYAFKSWAEDLQPGIENRVPARTKQAANETHGAVTLEPFWNPKNDPSTWQNISTYTIGFGTGATKWTGAPLWDPSNNNYGAGGDYSNLVQGSVKWQDVVTVGNARTSELWHMALNGRGKFYPAKDGAALTAAFKEIIGLAKPDDTEAVVNLTSASSAISKAGTEQYAAGYSASDWSGYVTSYKVSQNTGAVTLNTDWGTKPGTTPAKSYTTADKLDALSAADIASRLVLTSTGGVGGGISFEWDGATSLTAAQQALLNKDSQGTTDAWGADRVKYIRGDRAKENAASAPSFRARKTRQGDIVNSALWYVGTPGSDYSEPSYRKFAKAFADRLPMVYVGGNDGMLHGFSGEDGTEKIAYVPNGVIKNLPLLTSASYSHRYFVDGSPFSGDVKLGTNGTPDDWSTLLIGTLGTGGKGYFVLDITKPGSVKAQVPPLNPPLVTTPVATNFNKSSAATLVVMDKTIEAAEGTATVTDEVNDLGHIMVNPVVEQNNRQQSAQITQMNNGRWAVILGNGYNSKNENPVLLIQYLDSTKELLRINAAKLHATASGDNGLSAPRLLDLNGDGKVDIVYAGDLKGNVWKFDLLSATSSDWGVAFGGKPFYTATYTPLNGVKTAQPITAPPLLKPKPYAPDTKDLSGNIVPGVNGMMVGFGTGRNLTFNDRSSVEKQTFYSLLDNTLYELKNGALQIKSGTSPAPMAATDLLVEQGTTSTKIAGTGSSVGRDFWKMTQNYVSYDGKDEAGQPTTLKKGWFYHFPDAGERMLNQSFFFDNSNVVEVVSVVPPTGGGASAEASCDSPPTAGKEFHTFTNISTGKKASWQLLDTNGDGYYNSADSGTSRIQTLTGAKVNLYDKNRVTEQNSSAKTASDSDKFARPPEQALRPSWRQIQ